MVLAAGVTSSDFTLDGKFLLNHDTKQFINLDEYKANSIDKHGWMIHPLSLLIAVGNDRGSGDFNPRTPYGVRHEDIGTMIGIIISIHAPRMGCDLVSCSCG